MSRNDWIDDSTEVNNCLSDPNRTKPEQRSIIKRIWGHFQKYSSDTSIHGLQYIGQDARTLFERVWWSFIFICSIIFCGYFIYDSWYKWKTSPVIVSFAESMTPIWKVPFPAITICPKTTVRQSQFNYTQALYNFTVLKNISDEDLDLLMDTSLVCLFDDDLLPLDRNETLLIDDRSLQYLKEVALPLESLVFVCMFNNERAAECKDKFSTVLTNDGFCYTFNGLHESDIFTEHVTNNEYFLNKKINESRWSLEKGYDSDAGVNTYPVRGMGSGERGHLFLLMMQHEIDTDSQCEGVESGYKIYLHHPGEIPSMSSQYFHVPLDQHVTASIEPNIIATTDGLRSYSPRDRQCFFPNERKLRFYKEYTQNGCESECFVNYTIRVCNCFPHFLPGDDKSFSLCGPVNQKCLEKATANLIKIEIEAEINEQTYENYNYSSGFCDCLPSCIDLKYNTEVSQNVAKINHLFNAQIEKDVESGKEVSDMLKGMHSSILTVSFKTNKFITSKRSELYSVSDFLANCGGLLGLFMGFSILSLVEIFYFCSIRIICSKVKKQNKNDLEMTPKTNI